MKMNFKCRRLTLKISVYFVIQSFVCQIKRNKELSTKNCIRSRMTSQCPCQQFTDASTQSFYHWSKRVKAQECNVRGLISSAALSLFAEKHACKFCDEKQFIWLPNVNRLSSPFGLLWIWIHFFYLAFNPALHYC